MGKISRHTSVWAGNGFPGAEIEEMVIGKTPSWFTHTDPDRTHLYFAESRTP